MGAGETSGQRVTIDNKTRFPLGLVQCEVVHGKTLYTPDEIPPGSSCYIDNSGRNSASYGSHIIYKYRISGTPDEREWHLKIHSVGAYYRRNAGLGLQILKEGNAVFRQNLWDFQPDEYSPVEPNPECPFAVTIPESKRRQDLGSDFSEISVVIAMKEILIYRIIENGEVFVRNEACEPNFEHDFVSTSNAITCERSREERKIIKNTIDTKWGRTLKYSFNPSFNVKFGPDSVQISGSCGITTENVKVEEIKKENLTETTTICKQSFKWVLTKDVREEKSKRVKVTSQRQVYRQQYSGVANGCHDNVDIGYVERYEYQHNAWYI